MDHPRLKTERLELTAATPELVEAELEAPARLAEALAADVPGGWPPPLNSEETARFTLQRLTESPEHVGWWAWYVVRRDNGEGRRLVGLCGFKGDGGVEGTVEIGYSVLPEDQRQGYATEAARALVAWAFGHERVRRVIAETLPELTASSRVLENLGFREAGSGSEPGVVRYELDRSSFRSTV